MQTILTHAFTDDRKDFPDDIRQAITRSGYLLEQRIKPKIERHGYFVETNQAYPDPQTGISREYDISAISAVQLFRQDKDFLFPYILCECENNAQPLVFFETDSPISFLFHEQVKCSGMPVKFWNRQTWERMSVFLGFEKFHHYCRGRVATQYCSFTRKNNRWIATHLDSHHQTFSGLINALEAAIEDHYAKAWLPRKGKEEPINVQIYYPLVVVQGEIYLARETRKGLVLRKTKHVQFRREVWTTKRRDTYQIDVIHESFMGGYLKLVDREMEAVKRRMVRRRREVRRSIDRLIAIARRDRSAKRPWRHIYEPGV